MSRFIFKMIVGSILVGCASTESDIKVPQASVDLKKEFSECRNYYGSEVFDFCIYHNSEYILSVEDVDRYCPLAGVWEAECRFNWAAQIVRRQRHKIKDIELLLPKCNGYSDCAFELLDELPDPNIIRQLNLCKAYVKADYDDCVSHAIQRWTNGNPTEKEADEIMRLLPQLPKNITRYYAQAVLCQGFDSCEGSEISAVQCRRQMVLLNDSDRPCRRHGVFPSIE